MENNSIRQNITKEAIISTIKLQIDSDINKEKAILVVEGISDVKFFKGKLAKTVHVYESFSGKNGVKAVVSYFNSERIIGICDKDYDLKAINNIFYYDCSCLEMMMISNDVTFLSLVNEHYSGELTHLQLREKILQDLCWFSCLRKLNSKERWGIKFDGISFQKSFKIKTFTIDKNTLLKQIKKINKNFDVKSEKLDAVYKECNRILDLLDYYNITQGHDFIQYFHCICCGVAKKYQPLSVNAFEASLRCAYRQNDFERSDIYTKILNHQNKLSGIIFLDNA